MHDHQRYLLRIIMVRWQKTDNVQFGVATCKFLAFNSHHLPLSFGESVLIYEQTDNSEWYRGCPLNNRTIKGIFPVSHVEIKWSIECVSTSDADIASSKELSVVMEITSVLREWGYFWKQLFVKGDKDGVDHLRPMLNGLINQRRQVMSGTLTQDQLKKFRLDVSHTIDYGNKCLGLDLVVRDTEGNVIDVDSTGVIDLYKRHLEPAQRIKRGEYRRSKSVVDTNSANLCNVHNLHICVKNVVCKIGDDADVFITLYDGFENTYISEHYVIAWERNGMPKDLDKFQNLTAIFTDLGHNDLQRERLYLVCQIIKDGNVDSIMDNRKVSAGKLRRPFGVAVLHISDIVGGRKENTDKEIFVPLQFLSANDDVEAVIRKFIQKVPLLAQVTGQGIWLTLQMMHGDLDHVREVYSLLINQQTVVVRKQAFPDVIMPGDVRNDLYLTLVSGSFEKGSKTSSKNIQVCVSVHDNKGQLIDKVVSIGCGEPMSSEHISTVYLHNANPKWNEVIKLSIPIEKVAVGSTIRFAFKHRPITEEKDKSSKVFSVAYVNLIGEDGTFLQDGVHELALYKSEGKKFDAVGYLNFPYLKSDAMNLKKTVNTAGFFVSKTESFKITTKLCSTKLAQNVDLLALLKWRSQKQNLNDILCALVKVSGEEIVKFLQDTFDALFAILMEDSSNYGVMVCDAVVFCIGLLADKKYHRFRPIIDAYLENLFSSTKAYITLVAVLQKYLEQTLDPKSDSTQDSHDQLKKYYKSLEYYMKFIVRSRVLSEGATPGVGAKEFHMSLQNLLQTIVQIMKLLDKNLVIIQGCALKYLPAVFGDLLHVYDAEKLGQFAKEMIESIPQDRLLTPKLTCLHQMVKSTIFQNQHSRKVILPMLVHQLKTNLSNFEELQICADILNEMLSRFNLFDFEMGECDDDIEYLVMNLFRCNVETVIRMDLKGQQMHTNPDVTISQNLLKSTNNLKGNYVAFIVGMLDLMKERHYIAYIASYEDDYALLDGLMELFLVFREFVRGNIYPTDWVSMKMIQNNVILGALRYFCEFALCDRFLVGDNFQIQLWDQFFHLAVAFITQDSLQLEKFSNSKRNNILEKYSDMRMVIGNVVIDMWYRLGVNKMRLMTSVVQPFLEITLIPETELRRITIPVFFDMIQTEFQSRQHFKQVESEVIMQLDDLIETGMKGDEEYKELFSQILAELFRRVSKSNPRLCELGLLFVDTITKLISRLLDYRSVISSEDNINNRMSCNVNILNFYHEIKREEMKERYLYKLCDLHISVKSYTEAAFTLLLHAELLKWSDEPLSSANTNIIVNRYQDVKTQRELKERLYLEAIGYFDKGNMWEYGISRCKELAQQYEAETYDYVKLSDILNQEASFFENIIKTIVRPEPTYFRVGYFGRGFPTFLRNKLFIQRGDEFEKLGDFTMRMRTLYPQAQFLNTLDHPGEEVTQSLQQWIQICKVDPKPVERRKFRGKSVADQIKKFYEVNDVSEFALNRPFHRGARDKENEFATLWIERISMNTEYSFPGKLRWFEVKHISKIELSPIENAIDTMRAKNRELLTLLSQHSADSSLNYNNFSMVLNGTIDAAVMGGYANYERIFFSKEYLSAHPDDSIFIDTLKDLIVEQVDLCEQGLQIHKKVISKELEPFQKKMEDQLKQNLRKAMPYRKKDQRPKTFRHSLNSSPKVTRNNQPLTNREHNTMSTRSLSGIKNSHPNSGHNRHTFVVGSSSPVSNDPEAPPLPQKPVMNSGKQHKQHRQQEQLHQQPQQINEPSRSSLESTFEPHETSPSSVPNKSKSHSTNSGCKLGSKAQMSSSSENIELENFNNTADDDDDPPPLLPKKRSKVNRDQILHRSDVDSDSSLSLNDSTDSISNTHYSSLDGRCPLTLPPKRMSLPGHFSDSGSERNINVLSESDDGCFPSNRERVSSCHSDNSCLSSKKSPIMAKRSSECSTGNKSGHSRSSFTKDFNSRSSPSSSFTKDGERRSWCSSATDLDIKLTYSPDSPRTKHLVHPSHESAPYDTSPVMSPTMPLMSSSSSPPGISPIMPRKAPPAVPPPFVSPQQSPTSLTLSHDIITTDQQTKCHTLHSAMDLYLQPGQSANVVNSGDRSGRVCDPSGDEGRCYPAPSLPPRQKTE